MEFIMTRFHISIAFIALALPTSLSAQDANKKIDFPCRLGLESGKWKAFADGRVTPLSVTEMLKEDPDGSQLVRSGEGRFTSIWAGVQRKLPEEPQVIANLRESQERGAQALVDDAGGDLAKLMIVARRFPWADSVHRALLEAGGRELRLGHSQLAWRCFSDVTLRSADATLKTQAQVGIWLAAAHDPTGDSLRSVFKGVDLKDEYPWLGKKASAGDILQRLAPKAAAAAVPLKDLERKTLELPGSVSWLYELPTAHTEGLTIAGPSALAWYDGVQTKPAWTKAHALAPTSVLWGGLMASPVQPTTGGGRVYARWGVVTLGKVNLVANLAAFDIATGAQFWSSAGNADWNELIPVNDPTYADGRVYVLAVSRFKEYTPIHLVCFDAERGVLLWKRELVTNHTTLAGAGKAHVDVSHYGTAVAVAQGLVFCTTNLGVVACCDARDGLVEWERTYPQDRVAATLGRPGSAPVVAGGKVLFLPRDAGLCLIVDPVHGETAMNKTDDWSGHAIGASDGCVLLTGAQKLVALDVETGKPRWERAFPEPIGARSVHAGSAIYVGTKSKLYRLATKTGEIAEEQEWGKSGPMAGLVLRDKTLFSTRSGADVTSQAPRVDLPWVAPHRRAPFGSTLP